MGAQACTVVKYPTAEPCGEKAVAYLQHIDGMGNVSDEAFVCVKHKPVSTNGYWNKIEEPS